MHRCLKSDSNPSHLDFWFLQIFLKILTTKKICPMNHNGQPIVCSFACNIERKEKPNKGTMLLCCKISCRLLSLFVCDWIGLCKPPFIVTIRNVKRGSLISVRVLHYITTCNFIHKTPRKFGHYLRLLTKLGWTFGF